METIWQFVWVAVLGFVGGLARALWKGKGSLDLPTRVPVLKGETLAQWDSLPEEQRDPLLAQLPEKVYWGWWADAFLGLIAALVVAGLTGVTDWGRLMALSLIGGFAGGELMSRYAEHLRLDQLHQSVARMEATVEAALQAGSEVSEDVKIDHTEAAR